MDQDRFFATVRVIDLWGKSMRAWFLLFFLLVTNGTWAGPLDGAFAAYGRGDFQETVRLLRPLAEQGDAGAPLFLGIMYDEGLGVPQNYAEAAKWYRLAAERGHALAQYNLGFMYSHGKGVPQDYAEALKWLRLSAAQGDAGAQNDLGFMYSKGHGVLQDFVRAHMWFNLAGAAGDSDAAKNREIVAAKMTPQQVSEAQKLARDCQARQFKGCD
jgi:uncharacterized protein